MLCTIDVKRSVSGSYYIYAQVGLRHGRVLAGRLVLCQVLNDGLTLRII